MGQKVHPYGFRIGTLYGWQSNWFADKHYAEQLHEDIAIRKSDQARNSLCPSSLCTSRRWPRVRARSSVVEGRLKMVP